MFDLGPAATRMARLVQGVRADQLTAPTPCPEWRTADLLAHVHEFTAVFTANARKEPIPPLDGLPDDWRTVLPDRLDELARAWRHESAWQGRVSAGGVDLTGEQNALVAAEELVVHGWDLARATGQEAPWTEQDLSAVERFLEEFAAPIASGQGPYGPAVPVLTDAPRADRVLGRTGRDPGWTPTSAS
jgi:uncharacterized protein (TIGR03086 family)